MTATFSRARNFIDPGIEDRYGPSQQTIVFTFNNNVTGADLITEVVDWTTGGLT